MPRRYYYAPINPGYDQVAGDVMDGVNRGLAGFHDERDRRDAKARQEEMDRQRQELHELGLYERGVRRGEAPSETVDFRSRRGGEPNFGPRDVFAEGMETGEPGPGIGLQRRPGDAEAAAAGIRPEEGPLRGPGGAGGAGMALFGDDPIRFDRIPDEQLQVQGTRDGYHQITDDLYLDEEGTPEARARRERSRDMEAARREQEKEAEEMEGEIAAALQARNPELSDTRARLEARAIARGYAQDVDRATTPPAPRAPVRGTPEWEDALRRELGIREQFRPPRASTGTGSQRSPTYPQAKNSLEEMYAILNRFGDRQGTLLSPMQIHELALQMSRGEDPELPDPQQIREEWMNRQGSREEPPPARPSAGERFGGMLRNLFGRGGAAEDQAPATESPAWDPRIIEEGRAIIQAFPGYSVEELEEILLDEGFSPEEVEEILGGD